MSHSIGKRCRALASLPPDFHFGSGEEGEALQTPPKAVDDEFDDVATNHRFLVGTGLLTSAASNEILQLEYSEEERALTQSAPPQPFFPGEIWDLAPHPTKPMLLCTWSSPTEGFGLSLLRSFSDSGRLAGGENTRAAVFDKKSARQFATVCLDGTVKLWRFADSEPVVTSSSGSEGTSRGTRDVCFDPHNPNVLLSSCAGGAKVYDVRENMLHEAMKIETKTRCLTLDANPNRPHVFLTGGEDGQISFWDARLTRGDTLALMTFKKPGHEHWVTKARYNPFHDQLVASASSDGTAALWRAVSVSSTPLITLDGAGEEEQPQPLRSNANNSDVLVKSFGDNLDSVYGLAWSSVNAWVLASMSYDGKVKIHSVPSSEKYKILL